MGGLTERAWEWIEGDPDSATRAELEALIDCGDAAELADRMDGRVPFGTGGIRGHVGAGSNRINRAVIIETTAGLAGWLAGEEHLAGQPVVVGFDTRITSRQYAEDTIAVLAAAGMQVRYFADPVPTPLVAYAVPHLGAAAGVVVTASHNPADDNGYKIYDHTGVQMVPPSDAEIAACITEVGAANRVPYVDDPLHHHLVELVPATLLDDYWSGLSHHRVAPDEHTDFPIVYSPIHGTGRRYVPELLARAGYRNVQVVPSQAEPDGRFPTAPYPNPEQPEAVAPALEHATATGADLVLANDPDADRLAAAYPKNGGWHLMSGNEIGCLLAEYLLSRHDPASSPFIVTTIVSSPLIHSIAAAFGASVITTLTGFKWVASAALELEQSGYGTFVFGFEESLGFTVGSLVRDKDGLSAAVLLADLVADGRANGTTLDDRLYRLATTYGISVSAQKSVRLPGQEGRADIEAAMTRLASDPPAQLGNCHVVAVTDFSEGAEERPRWLPTASVVELKLEEGARVLVRPSGTEPKLKAYIDIVTAPTSESRPARTRAQARAETIMQDLSDRLGLGRLV